MDSIQSMDRELIQELSRIGIDEAEQVISLAAITHVRPFLSQSLDIKDAELASLLEALREAIPPEASAAAVLPAIRSFALGALEPTSAIAAEIDNAKVELAPSPVELANLPSNVNHVAQMPPIRNQGGRGTCVAFAMTAVHEFHRKMAGTAQDFSEQFLYYETKLIDGHPNDCGTWQIRAAQVLAGKGECRELVWSYNPAGACNQNGEPANARTDGASFKLPTIVLGPKDVNAIKFALAGGATVGFSIPVYDSWYHSAYTRQTGRINMRVGSEPQVGGHAMCFVGYQDDSSAPGGGFFILRNSWDLSWGYQCIYGAGYGTIPYAYISSDGWEAVTATPAKHLPVSDEKTPWAFGGAISTGFRSGGEAGAPSSIVPDPSTSHEGDQVPDILGVLHTIAIPPKIIARINVDPRLPPFDVQWYWTGHAPEYVMLSANHKGYIIYNEHGRNDQSSVIQFTNGTLKPTFDFGGDVRGGAFICKCSINWHRTTDGATGTTPEGEQQFGILGDNPAKATIRGLLPDVQLQVICYKESRFRQFDNVSLPLFGPPAGFGAMQLDTPSPSARQLWDWRQNVAGGVSLYSSKKTEVNQHFKNVYTAYPHAPKLSAEQVRLALYQFYNGGFYWEWDDVAKSWKKYGNFAYADDSMRIEQMVNAGTPPADWN
ncbi:hypothetical protein X773_26790 [Mesorhizobium sp. LSJC285A00]|uniref:C1 family peptidase n=1 Tax=Mesorhizobium sp. LSJC285A00 TaxID=1287338 RepID=UPI0003CF88A9|nr:C1 family peptidase [Mesorhizobium sp. LSJC285A00]ESW74461.1 hypothetical protein X773_26790 [Mesorhizobium sp. LSJC285A00]